MGETCEHHEALCQKIESMVETQAKVNGTLDKVNEALGDGKVKFARLCVMEKIFWPLVVAVLMAVLTAILALVIK